MKIKINQSLTFVTVFVLLTLLSLPTLSLVFADGDSRPATPAEKQFSKSVQNLFAKVVPPGPQGWDQTNDTTQIEELETVTPGVEKLLLQVDYRIAWQDTKRMNESQEALINELMKHTAPDPELTSLNAQYNKLADQYGKALAQKNNAEANRISKEMEAVGKKMQVINARHDKEMQEIQIKMAPHDVKARITLNANVLSEGIYQSQFNPAPSVAGGLTYRSTGEYTSANGWVEGTTYVFLGRNWKINRNGGTYMNATPNKALPHTVVQTIIVEVQADPDRAQQIIKNIDWDSLKKLIKN